MLNHIKILKKHFHLDFFKLFLGNFYLDWQCEDCTINYDGDSVIVENRFSEPSDFELATEIHIQEFQNVRITVKLEDYVADMIQVSGS